MPPRAHGDVVGHLRTIHGSDGRNVLMCHGANRFHVVLHGQIHVARTDAFTRFTRLLMVVRSIHHGTQSHLLRFEARTATWSEIRPQTAVIQHHLSLGIALVIVSLIVELTVQSRYLVVKLRHDGQHLHLHQHGIRPQSFEHDVQLSILVLMHLRPILLVAEATQIGKEPDGKVVAPVVHELNLLFGDMQSFQHRNLFLLQLPETLRITQSVAVHELILHSCARKVVYDGAAHAELIQVGVCEMLDNLFHILIVFNVQHST